MSSFYSANQESPYNYEIVKLFTIASTFWAIIGMLISPGLVRVTISLNQVGLTLTVVKGFRVLVTVLTKKLAEDLTNHYLLSSVKVKYMHSDIETLERIEILRDLRELTALAVAGCHNAQLAVYIWASAQFGHSRAGARFIDALGLANLVRAASRHDVGVLH